MSNSIDLAKHLARRSPLPFPTVPGALVLRDETPAHQFTIVVAPILDGRYCVVLPSRDFFDERLATTVILFVVERAPTFATVESLVLLDHFSCPQYAFDAVAVLGPRSARPFGRKDEVLNEHAFVTFPIYRCELSGNESAEEIDLIRHEVLPSLDWMRSPCPKITMAYWNAKNKAGSGPRLTKLATVLFEVEQLHEAEESWIELENYAHRQCRIVWSDGNYAVEFGEQEVRSLDRTVLRKCLTEFLTRDQSWPRSSSE